MMTRYIYLLILILLINIASSSSRSQSVRSVLSELSEATLAEDGKLNFTQLATKYGHGAEQHEVTTEDGYIITVFRLGDKNGVSVMLLPGISDVADTFIIRGNTSLAITLANAGYNVWVGNTRGTKFGRRHVTLDPDNDEEFWNFSLHEIGYYDLAAMIDYVCEKTGEESIVTIAHSQGTTAHYVLCSTRTEYNSRITLTISLAPVAFLNNVVPPVSLLMSAFPEINLLLKSFGINELLQDHKAASDLVKFICSKGIVSYAVCACGLLFPFAGFNPNNIKSDFIGVLVGHFPAATSRKSFEHFDQIFLRKKFAQYDYGLANNLVKYGKESPPDYDLSGVTVKAALLVGPNDQLSRVKDVEHLKDSLSNVVHYEVMQPKLWSHADFIWGEDMPENLYPSIFKLLTKYV